MYNSPGEYINKCYNFIHNTIISNFSTRICVKKIKTKNRYIRMPDIATLINLVNSTSMLKIGRMYNVSDNAVRKWCIKLGITYKRAVL